jgi:hypothetical protein
MLGAESVTPPGGVIVNSVVCACAAEANVSRIVAAARRFFTVFPYYYLACDYQVAVRAILKRLHRQSMIGRDRTDLHRMKTRCN